MGNCEENFNRGLTRTNADFNLGILYSIKTHGVFDTHAFLWNRGFGKINFIRGVFDEF